MDTIRTNNELAAIATSAQEEQLLGRRQHATITGPGDKKAGLVLQALAGHVLRYGLVLVIGWIGLMKFTAYEAAGIQPLVASSPLMGWMYSFLSVRQFSAGLGIVELSIAVMIALRPWSPWISALGSATAVPMFLTTLTFLFSAPGWEPTLGGFPSLSASVGQFVIKDLVLLGAAIWTTGEARSATSNPNQRHRSAVLHQSQAH